MSTADEFRVPWEKTCWKCDQSEFSFQCTDDLEPLDRFIGQDRALDAMHFGLEVDKPGYNLFVTGLTGTGKTSAIKSLLQSIIDDPEQRERKKPVEDWCYVHNFDDPDRPRALRLPLGMARTVRARLNGALEALREEMPKVFQSEEYETRRREVEAAGRQVTQQMMTELEQAAQAVGFAVQVSPVGMSIFPMKDSQPMAPEEYQALPPEQRQALDKTRTDLMQQTQDAMTAIRQAEQATADQIAALERESANGRVTQVFGDLLDSAGFIPGLWEYLNRTVEYVLDHLNLFKEPGANPLPGAPGPAAMAPPAGGSALARNPFLPFEINVLVDNTGVTTVPIVVEPNPNWGNLFGRIERLAMMGTYFSDHTMLKPGAFHSANGGYLVLNARDMLMYPAVWEGMKRILRNREIRLEDPTEQAGLLAPMGLRPEPMLLDVKVIITGDEQIYRMLTTADNEDFRDLFKVKAEFDHQVKLSKENVDAYCAFICYTCHEEGLLAFDSSGAARVLEYAARLVNDQTKLSTRFGQIKDLLIEADYWARKEDCLQVAGSHVSQAVAKRDYRLNLTEERIRELVTDGSVLMEVTDEVVGQVNGLAVYDLGDFSFGRPTRITGQIFAGREGVINIEREAAMSGRTHDKGVLILSGYLGARYGQDRPLTLSATLAFEQNYEGVDGDSASSTELYAILSSLSDLPLKQGIAVTGSVNQKGEIQPIGGVNQKIEGMYDVCRVLGLTGNQGVMVPRRNLRNLMLREDVVEAIKEGKFHIYAIDTIDQGMEILTGHPAGERRDDGSYPEGTSNHRVDQRLKELHECMRGYYGELVGAAR
ncbi:MAG: hypothetical protein BZY88_02915 [SAR202 cluster bacterium Io17-Chloro-G9]|nr:MAG: hypothetical protein BZY88_02915 [SAR202 cluster bacterium Io17-Chloro-G9]